MKETILGKEYIDGVLQIDQAVLSKDKVAAKKRIDAAAEGARQGLITQGDGMMEVYKMKYEAAMAYKLAGYPSDATPFPILQEEAAALSMTPKALADTIIATRDRWSAVLGRIEGLRLKSKALVDKATTPEAVAAVAVAFSKGI